MLSALFALSATLTYCSDETSLSTEPAAENAITTSNLRAKSPVLFSFANSKDLETNFKSSIIDEMDSYTVERSTMPNVTRIMSYVKIANGQAIIVAKHYINENTHKFVKSNILAADGLSYNTTNVNVPYSGTPVGADLIGLCPGGSTTVGYCGPGTTASMANCIGNLAAQVAQQSLSTGYCGSALVQEGLFGAAVCSTGCN